MRTVNFGVDNEGVLCSPHTIDRIATGTRGMRATRSDTEGPTPQPCLHALGGGLWPSVLVRKGTAMNRLRHLWIRTRFASLAIIAMVLGASLNAPMPAQAAIMDCGAQQVASLSVGTYTAQEIANNPTLYNDLPGAINKAVEILKTCGNTSKEAVVTITTSAKNLEMPNQIGDRDYGLLILQGQDGAQPIMGKPDQRVVNKTRLTVSNLSFDIQSDYFNPEVFFNAHKCTVFGHGGSETFLTQRAHHRWLP